METMVRGSRKPDLEIHIGDADGEADFSPLTTADVRIRAEMDGSLLFDDTVDEITAAADGKSAVVRRVWAVDDTDTVGRMWIAVIVDWGSGYSQLFPSDGPLRLDIVRAPGDA
jgi:hypothetical protein